MNVMQRRHVGDHLRVVRVRLPEPLFRGGMPTQAQEMARRETTGRARGERKKACTGTGAITRRPIRTGVDVNRARGGSALHVEVSSKAAVVLL